MNSVTLSKRMALCLALVVFLIGTGFRAGGGTLHYGGGSGPQIVATYDGYNLTVAYGTPGTIRLDYNAGGYLYNAILTAGTPYPIPSNTSSVYLSNYQSTSYYSIY